jgi:polyketide cyclase/dehydrase/lipid transport protein
MANFILTRTIAAPVDKVWAVGGDFMKAPGPGVEVKVEKRGNDTDNVGAERTITIGSVKVRERLETVGPGKSFSYKILSGAPMKDHLATATFTAKGSATEIRWVVALTPKIPGIGWIVALVTKKTVNQYLDVVAKAAQ